MIFSTSTIERSPLPIAQLYQRFASSKDSRDRHSNCFYLLEAYIKLAASPMICCYLDEVQSGEARVESLDMMLRKLALPSLGHWVGFLRELSRHFGQRVDHSTHPFGHLWTQLNQPRTDSGLLNLFRRIKNGPDGKPTGDQKFRLLDLFGALVQYRNTVFGHGANRHDDFYEKIMGPMLGPAIEDLLAENVLEFLGPKNSQLVYINTKRTIDEDTTEIEFKELIGFYSRPANPKRIPNNLVVNLASDRVGVLWPGRQIPLSLSPLLIYRQKGMTEEVSFLNRDRNGRQVEYLCYSSGEVESGGQMVQNMARLLSQVTGQEIDHAKLAELVQQSLSDTPSIEAILDEPTRPPRVMGDFEILGEIGRGGMGVVYLARQQSLGRLVALKTLPADMVGDETARVRFQREIRVLASCNHPNIIQVLSSGSLPSGQLFYAMEYISGASIEDVWKEFSAGDGDSQLSSTTFGQAVFSASKKSRDRAIERNATGDREPAGSSAAVRRKLEIPELPAHHSNKGANEVYQRRVAALIRDVALALGRVHEQKIVHRDVKPSNLMLTADGSRIVLMDFGLAKGDQNSTLNQSRQAGLLGTLRYAAPEQLRVANLQTNVDHRADIRGLGATIWELLARQRLFGEAQNEAALTQMVLTQDVPLLRSIDKAIHPDLEAIVARACERQCENRIASIADMADYLDLYLNAKPIPIRTPSTVEKLKRWAYDHKGLAATLVAAVLGSSTAIGLINHQRHLALVAEQEADEHRQDALDLYRMSRSAIDNWLIRSSEVLTYFPATQSIRKELLTRAAHDYASLSESKSSDPELILESIRAESRVGDIQLDQEDYIQARKSYEKALVAFDAQPPARSNSNELLVRWRVERARTRCKLGVLCSAELQVRQAESQFRQSLDELQSLRSENPDALIIKQAEATTLDSFATMFIGNAEYNAALTILEKSEAVLAGESGTGDESSQLAFLNVRVGLGRVLGKLGRHTESAAAFSTAIEQLKLLLAKEPEQPAYADALANAFVSRAATQQSLGETLSQLRDLRSAEKLYSSLQRSMPDVPRYLEARAITLTDTGLVQFEADNLEGSLKSLHEAQQQFEHLVNFYPRVPSFRFHLAATMDGLCQVYRVQALSTEALEAGNLAYSLYESLANESAAANDGLEDVRKNVERAAIVASHIAQVNASVGKADLALEHFGRAIDYLEQLNLDDPNIPDYQNELAHVLFQRGIVHAERQKAEAKQDWVRALALWTELDDDNQAADYAFQLARFHLDCPLIELRNAAAALDAAAKAVRLAPANYRYLVVLAEAQARVELYDESQETLGQAQANGLSSIANYLSVVVRIRIARQDVGGAKSALDEALGWAAKNRPGDIALKHKLENLAELLD